MKTRASTLALIALCSRIDDLVQFDAPDDKKKDGLVKTGAEVAGGAGLVGGGFLADRAIMKKYGQQSLLGTGEIKPGSARSISTRTATDGVTGGGSAAVGRGAAYRQAASDIGNASRDIGRAARSAGRQAYTVARADGQGLLKSAGMGARKFLKVAGSKVAKVAKAFSGRERLLALAAQADEVIEFAPLAPTKMSPVAQAGVDRMKRLLAAPKTKLMGWNGQTLKTGIAAPVEDIAARLAPGVHAAGARIPAPAGKKPWYEMAAGERDVHSFELTGMDHLLRHNWGPLTPALQAKKGERMKGVKEAGAHYMKNSAAGTAIGAGAGALLAGGAGALLASRGHFHGVKPGNRLASRAMVRESGRHIATGVANGALLGGGAGLVAGNLKGVHDKKARAIQEKYKARP